MTHIDIDLTQPVRQQFDLGDYVLYRNPVKFLTGQPDHTTVAQAGLPDVYGRIPVVDLVTGKQAKADPRFLRLIPAADIMRDIDEAPLSGEHPDLVPAAVAWLRLNIASQGQQLRVIEGGDQR